jgi:hypothetical protein
MHVESGTRRKKEDVPPHQLCRLSREQHVVTSKHNHGPSMVLQNKEVDPSLFMVMIHPTMLTWHRTSHGGSVLYLFKIETLCTSLTS